MQPQLYYQPIVFIKTWVIGGQTSNDKEKEGSFDFTHRHIVTPKNIITPNPVVYILFHTPAIYNWLLTVPCRQSELLNNYLTEQTKRPIRYTPINTDNLLQGLEDYARKWQVTKVSFASTVYISRVRQTGSSACDHLPKTQQKVVLLNYNSSRKQLSCQRVRCKSCQRFVQIEGQIRKLSPCFISKYGVQQLWNGGIEYEPYMVFTRNGTFIKAANKIWYQLGQTTKTVALQKIDFKTTVFALYQLKNNESIFLTKPIINVKETKKDNQKMIVEKEKKQSQQLEGNQNQTKKLVKVVDKVNPLEVTAKKKKMRQLHYQANKVLLKDEEQNNKTYVQDVKKNFITPKTKDEYELQYDQGKKKKKKEKKDYIQPNYDQVFKDVKARAHEQVGKESRKIKKKTMRDRRQKQVKGYESD